MKKQKELIVIVAIFAVIITIDVLINKIGTKQYVPPTVTSIVTTTTTEMSYPTVEITSYPEPEYRRPQEYDSSLSLADKEAMVEECNEYIDYLSSFEFNLDKDAIILDTEEVIELYLEDINVWEEKANEYPVAARVWRWATEEMGYSEYVAAGIIGNMMAEVGGHTLALKPTTKVGQYYGLCMWYLRYSPSVNGRDIEGQLDFLANTIERNMGTGHYSQLLNSTSAQSASVIFATYYERCMHPYGRQGDAMRAYRYFTS